MASSGTDNAKVTLYWLDRSRAQRVVWLLEECKGIDYNIEVFKRTAEKMAPPELQKIHPLGKSPVISVESSNTSKPIVIAESGTLTEYLCDHFAQHLIPKHWQDGKDGQVGGETAQWLRYRFYMHYAEGSLMSILLVQIFMDIFKGPQIPFFVRPITSIVAGRVESVFLKENYRRHFGLLESELATSPDGGQYLCGKDLTAADILMSFPLIAARSKIDQSNYPKLHAYIDALMAHKTYVSSIKRIEQATGEKFEATIRE